MEIILFPTDWKSLTIISSYSFFYANVDAQPYYDGKIHSSN